MKNESQIKNSPLKIFVLGKRFKADDEDFKSYHEINETVTESARMIAILDFFPWIETILPNFILRKVFKMDLYYEFCDILTDITKVIEHFIVYLTLKNFYSRNKLKNMRKILMKTIPKIS